MATASNRVVAVFGGTGFLGRSVVQHLRLYSFFVRIASRHPDRGHALLGPDDPQLRSIEVDVRDERSVASNRPQKSVECSAVRVAYLVDPADAMLACLIAGASVAVSAAA